jgi:hypothetical protein
VSLLECRYGPRSFNVFKIWVCRLSGLEVILSMHNMARGGLQVSLVSEYRFKSSLRLTPLMRRFEDLNRRPPGARMSSDVAIHSIASQL